jgi:hypothetical protein
MRFLIIINYNDEDILKIIMTFYFINKNKLLIFVMAKFKVILFTLGIFILILTILIFLYIFYLTYHVNFVKFIILIVFILLTFHFLQMFMILIFLLQ